MDKTKASRLSVILLTGMALILIADMAVITRESTYLVPFLYGAIYFVTFLFWKANEQKFPYYFHVCLFFLLMNNNMSENLTVINVSIVGMCLVIIGVIISMLISLKKKESLHSNISLLKVMKIKYRVLIRNNPNIILRTSIHAVILFIIAWIGCLGYEHRGFWFTLSGTAVLIGEEIGRIHVRGLRRIVGAVVAFAITGLLVVFSANDIILIILYILTIIGMGVYMPKRYILGSASIAIQATIANALMDGGLGMGIVIERIVWTITGALLTIVLCYVFNYFFSKLYHNYEREKIVLETN